MLLFLWSLHLQLRPFRLFESGLPQPADYIMLLVWLLLLVGRTPTLSQPIVSYRRSFACFVIYAALVNTVWWFLRGESTFLMPAAYYLYNFLGCDAFLKLYGHYGKRFLQFTAGSIWFALVVQFLAATGITTEFGARETLFFVNPNQLGYYVVLSMSVIWACWTSRGANAGRVPAIFEVVAFGCAGYLMLLSQSRAGFGAICVVLLGRVLNGNRLLVGASIVALIALCVSMESSLLTAMQERSESKRRETTEEMSLRGYDRIVNHPKYLVFGAGEGEYDRFESGLDGELHSSFGTILFSYGIVGFVLASRMVRNVVRAAGVSALIYLAPVAVYSLTHNGLRQLELWWLMPLVICLRTGTAQTIQRSRATLSVRRRGLLPAFSPARLAIARPSSGRPGIAPEAV